ncbi:MAG TPA: four-carbon acid sugar kinase family protein [Bacteroidales bacterium]|nr:four-carbon acid sugar kinase family protein [Bacteroidales bacterium]
MKDPIPFFYILTNSRSMDPETVKRITKNVVHAIIHLNREFQFRLIFISRSDSTLRGHFPLEPDVIRDTILSNNIVLPLPVFFIPAFLEAGRYTIDNIQYLRDNDELIPVADTEFAKDSIFDYTSSDLKDYIIEKSKNKINKNQVGAISITDIRKNSIREFIEIIRKLINKKYIIINALDYGDLRKFALSFLKFFTGLDSSAVLRTSSSLPKALSGIGDKTLLSGKDIIRKEGPGLFIVGSHVKKTTLQLQSLLKHPEVQGIEMDVNEILANPELLQKTIQNINEIFSRNFTPVVYTSRKELRSGNHTDRLLTGKKISSFLVNIVRNLHFTPAYIVTKGGITSHDIITDGLNIKYARVMGQILAGVPVVMTGEMNKFPKIPVIIFPGNVGDDNSLNEVFKKLYFTNASSF